jgi:hypothetical protein
MTDKLPSYIEFTPQTDDNYTAIDDNDSSGGGGGWCDLTSNNTHYCTKNGDDNARDCGNWRGGEDTMRAVSSEDLDALKRMVRDMLSNPDLLHILSLNSVMTESSYGAAAVSQAFPSSFPMECEESSMPLTPNAATRLTMPRAVPSEDLDALKRIVRDMLSNPELPHMAHLYSGIVGGVASSLIQEDSIMTEESYGAAVISQAFPSSIPMECEATFMPVTSTAATRLKMSMSPYLCQECNCSAPPSPPRRTSPKQTVTMSCFPPLPFHPYIDL